MSFENLLQRPGVTAIANTPEIPLAILRPAPRPVEDQVALVEI